MQHSSNELQNFAFYSIDKAESDSRELTFKSDRASLLRSLDGFHDTILAAAAKANELLPLWRCAWREPALQMYRGRLVIVGDAFHAMLPHLGQGAGQSIEDAAALGVLLQDSTVEGSDDYQSIEARLQQFENLRIGRVTDIQILSTVPGVEDDFGKACEMWDQYRLSQELPSMCVSRHCFSLEVDITTDMVFGVQCRIERRCLRFLLFVRCAQRVFSAARLSSKQ